MNLFLQYFGCRRPRIRAEGRGTQTSKRFYINSSAIVVHEMITLIIHDLLETKKIIFSHFH